MSLPLTVPVRAASPLRAFGCAGQLFAVDLKDQLNGACSAGRVDRSIPFAGDLRPLAKDAPGTEQYQAKRKECWNY